MSPNPSPAEILASANLVTGALAAAQTELLNRLAALLPGTMAAYNSAQGLTGGAALVPPARYALAPAVLSDDYLNSVLVDAEVTTTSLGVGAFLNTAHVSVHCVDERVQAGLQAAVYWERAELVRACLLPFLNGCVNAASVRVWRELMPTGYRRLTHDWARLYAGTTCTFLMIQTP